MSKQIRINQVVLQGTVVDLNDDSYVLQYSEKLRVLVVMSEAEEYPEIGEELKIVGYLCEEGVQEVARCEM